VSQKPNKRPYKRTGTRSTRWVCQGANQTKTAVARCRGSEADQKTTRAKKAPAGGHCTQESPGKVSGQRKARASRRRRSESNCRRARPRGGGWKPGTRPKSSGSTRSAQPNRANGGGSKTEERVRPGGLAEERPTDANAWRERLERSSAAAG